MNKDGLSIQARSRSVQQANTDDFVELIKIARFDPYNGDLTYSNWSGINFDNCDLRNFDFTGSRLVNCTFNNSLISGARFDLADLKNAVLSKAADWEHYVSSWNPYVKPLSCRHLRTAAVFQEAPFAPELIVLPLGDFLMGSPDGTGGINGVLVEIGRTEDERSRHLQTIRTRFAIGRYPVTLGEFKHFVKEVGHTMPDSMVTYENKSLKTRDNRGWLNPGFTQNDDHPVVGVRWQDACAYADWLSNKFHCTYKLPSEIEWEYAARAGTNTAYWWGEEIDNSKANYQSFTRRRDATRFGRTGCTVPVKSYDPNPWGLYQTHGNVWEWCDDEYRKISYGIDDSISGRSSNISKAMRGGSWRSDARHCRSANRSREKMHLNYIGFRIMREL